MINKSIIEDFELADGTQVYIQSGASKRISLSFDDTNRSQCQYLTLAEAKELAEKINKVLTEV